MQCRGPPMNVILAQPQFSTPEQNETGSMPPHMFEKIPGSLASCTLLGKPSPSHRSGLNSSASSPQISLLVFAVVTPIRMSVPFGIGIDVILLLPSAPLIGTQRGRVVALRALSACSKQEIRASKIQVRHRRRPVDEESVSRHERVGVEIVGLTFVYLQISGSNCGG